MEREVLTNKNIKYDLLQLFIKNLVSGLVSFGASLIAMIILHVIFPTELLIFKILFIIIMMVYCLILSSFVIYIVKFLNAYIKNKFFVLEDELIGLAEYEIFDGLECGKTRTVFRWDRMRLFYGMHASNPSLYLKDFGKFLVLEGYHYKWSKNHMMDAETIYNRSSVKDIFYVVTINKRDVLLVYNTKIFKYIDN